MITAHSYSDAICQKNYIEKLVLRSSRWTPQILCELEFFPNLKKLEIYGRGPLQPPPLHKAPQLTSLTISGPVLEKIPTDYFFHPRLKMLKIRNLPANPWPDIQRPKSNLTSFYIYQGQLECLPQWVAYLPLEELVIQNQKLQQLPSSLALMPKLKHLNVQNNCLKTFPFTPFDLPNLNYLGLEGNKSLAHSQILEKFRALNHHYKQFAPLS